MIRTISETQTAHALGSFPDDPPPLPNPKVKDAQKIASKEHWLLNNKIYYFHSGATINKKPTIQELKKFLNPRTENIDLYLKDVTLLEKTFKIPAD